MIIKQDDRGAVFQSWAINAETTYKHGWFFGKEIPTGRWILSFNEYKFVVFLPSKEDCELIIADILHTPESAIYELPSRIKEGTND